MKRTARVLLSVALLGAAAAVDAADDTFSNFRGVDGRGRATGLPPGDGPLDFELAWKRSLGSGYSGIAIAGDRLVSATADRGRDWIVALDAATGAELWRYDLAPTYAGHDGSHDGPISTPAIADGRVFALGPEGQWVALDLASGGALWARDLPEELGAEPPFYGFGSSPVVVGGSVYLLIDGGEEGGDVVAFDAATGAIRWRAGEIGDVASQSPIAATLVGGRQILAFGSERAIGVDPESGTVLWQQDLEGRSGPMGAFTQSPLPIDDDTMLIKHQDGQATLVRLARDGDTINARVIAAGRGLARSYSPPAVGPAALFGYSARFLSAVDGGTGELLWRSREPGDGFLVTIDDRLAVLTKTGTLHLGPAAVDGWRESAKLDLFSDLAWTPPSYADGALYLRSLGEIARVDLVRRERPPTVAATVAVPAVLAELEAALAAAPDNDRQSERVDTFLAARELPLIDGGSVTFAWHGAAEDVAIAGDMIGMRREEPMRRLGDSDLWWWSTELPEKARISYLFFVDDEPRSDPSHERTVRSTVLGTDMNWNRGEGMEMSWFAMPGWPGAGTPAADRAAVEVETVELELTPAAIDRGDAGRPEPEPMTVTLQVWLPPGYEASTDRYPVVYVHNRRAFDVGQWPATLERVVGSSVEPLIAVAIDAPRRRDFATLFAEQVVPQVDARYRTVATAAGRANVGMGWNGLTAAAITLSNPELFGALAVQSMYLLDAQMAALERAIGDATAETTPLDIYLEWGRWDLLSPHEEMNMRASSRWAWELFEQRGWRPVGGEVWDSTDFGSWRNRTAVLLEALFGVEGATGTLARWQTEPASGAGR